MLNVAMQLIRAILFIDAININSYLEYISYR